MKTVVKGPTKSRHAPAPVRGVQWTDGFLRRRDAGRTAASRLPPRVDWDTQPASQGDVQTGGFHRNLRPSPIEIPMENSRWAQSVRNFTFRDTPENDVKHLAPSCKV